MRGIILAGGTGSRLGPLTKAVNKHLLQVSDVPMIYHPINVLHINGIEDITIVSSPDGVGQLAKLLGGGYTYRVQDTPGGIAEALLCAKTKSRESIAVILGDNVFSPPPKLSFDNYANVLLVEVDDPRAFGVAKLEWNTIVGVVEKPEVPPSDYVVPGLYVFDEGIFGRLKDVGGEYAMTSLLDSLAQRGLLSATVYDGFWGDAGTLEGLELCRRGLCES